MSDLERFRQLIDQMRPIAESAREKYEAMSPLAKLWGRELDGNGRHMMRAAYRSGGLPLVMSGVAHILEKSDPTMTPFGLIETLEEIAKLEEASHSGSEGDNG